MDQENYPDAKNGDKSRDGRYWTRNGLGNKEINKRRIAKPSELEENMFLSGMLNWG